MPKVTFHHGDETTEVDAQAGQTLLQTAQDNAIPMEFACGGNGFCTTCKCQVKEGMEHLSARNDKEENMGVIDDPYRLGCQAEVEGDVTVEVLES